MVLLCNREEYLLEMGLQIHPVPKCSFIWSVTLSPDAHFSLIQVWLVQMWTSSQCSLDWDEMQPALETVCNSPHFSFLKSKNKNRGWGEEKKKGIRENTEGPFESLTHVFSGQVHPIILVINWSKSALIHGVCKSVFICSLLGCPCASLLGYFKYFFFFPHVYLFDVLRKNSHPPHTRTLIFLYVV